MSNFQNLTRSARSPSRPKVIPIGEGVAPPHIGEFTRSANIFSQYFLRLAHKATKPHIIYQTTQSDARMCLLGVWLTMDEMWGSGGPKTSKHLAYNGKSPLKWKRRITRKRWEIRRKWPLTTDSKPLPPYRNPTFNTRQTSYTGSRHIRSRRKMLITRGRY